MTTPLPYGDLSGDFDPPITPGPDETLCFGLDSENYYAFILYGADGQPRLIYRRQEDGVYRLSATP